MEMPRPRLPNLHKERVNGRVIWYVRDGHGPRTRIRAAYGTPEFRAEYDAAMTGKPVAGPRGPGAGTLKWLIDRYRESERWSSLSLATRRQRENIFRHVITAGGAEPIGAVDRGAIIRGVDRRRATPAAARHFLETMRGLFRWAVYAELAGADPTDRVVTPRRRTDGHHVWSLDECERFEAHWPLGTRERLAFDVLLWTGLRRGDAVRLGRQHERDGMFVIKTEKTGEVALVPVMSQLRASIAAGPCGDLTYIAGERGGNLTKESFGNWFRDACRAAGVPGSAHGLRKAHATRAAQYLTEAELEAIHGWARGSRMSRIYTNTVNREKLAQTAILKLNKNTPFPHSVSGAGMTSKSKGKSNA